MKKILVTGGTGFIGRKVCDTLHNKDYDVNVVSRNPEKAKTKLEAVGEIYGWNPESEQLPTEAISETEAVIHLAGETIAGRWNTEKKQRIRDSRVLSTRNLVESCANAESKPDVLICASAIGLYGDSGDNSFTEETPPGTDYLAEVCKEWETEAYKASELGIRVVTVRIGLVLGLGGGMLQQVLTPFKIGIGGKLGSGQQWMSWIHVDDVVGIILHALENDSINGALNATAPVPVRNIEFTKALGSVLGKPTILPAPYFGLKLMMGEFADFVLLSQKVLPEKTVASGYEFQFTTIDSALSDLLLK
ncbi:TIGR01777 family protein [Candidatus Poribacteria bacterium]|nr:TIGR01777 family protein [Candidatus Poribacteria bacterium]MYB63583.1 TIGR01777 family protein [Candidatus Poribacteria bacterium]MYF57155.1 TIGR01777 family protein [Candidatus Poribacteria bacterium]MYI94332.1 TIGR01777 family protein [Candidatus Poribacteria bacterium]